MSSGILRLIQSPHPSQEDLQLFLLEGDVTVPIREVVPDKGVTLSHQLARRSLASRQLKILHINDFHHHLSDFSRIARQIREQRSRYQDDPSTAILAMSAGDDMIGSLFDELLVSKNPVHAAYSLYSAAGINISVIGNHDLDLGIARLAKGIRQDARFPVLSANLRNCPQLKDLYYPAAVFVTKGIRVGVIGLTTIAQVRQPSDADLEIANPISVVQNILPAIRPLCDVIIILSHLGYSQATRWVETPVECAGDVKLAQALPKGSVDLIVGSHSHNILNENGISAENIVHGIPIVQAGSFGDYLGQVDISLEKNLVTSVSANLIATEGLPRDRDFEEKEMQPLMDRVKEIKSEILGRVDDIPELGADAVKNGFALDELAFANFITDGMAGQLRKSGYEIDFAMMDASNMMTGLPFGQNLTFGDWFKVMPYADTVRLYKLTGQELFDLIEENIARMDIPGEERKERGFLQFSKEIRYIVDLDEMRIKNVEVRGVPLKEKPDSVFTVATSIFTRELAGKWEIAKSESGASVVKLQNFPHQETDIYLRKLLVAYIREQSGITKTGGAKLDGRLQIIKTLPHSPEHLL